MNLRSHSTPSGIWLCLLAAALPISIAGSSLLFFPLLVIVIGAALADPSWRWHWSPLEKTWLLFFSVGLLSTFLSVAPLKSLHTVGEDIYFSLFLLPLMLIREDRWRQRCERIFIIGVAFVAFIGIVQATTGIQQYHYEDGGIRWETPTAFRHWSPSAMKYISQVNHRSTGTRSHPLTYAETLLFGWAWLLAAVGRRGGRGGWTLAGLLLVGGALLVAKGRGPWLAAGGMLVLSFLMQRGKSSRGILCGVGVVLLLSVLLSPALRQRAESVTSPDLTSNSERLDMWKVGLAVAKDYPLLGVGAGNIKRVVAPYQVAKGIPVDPWGHLHSLYINMLAERGTFGLSLFLSAMILFGIAFWRQYRMALPGSPSERLAVAGLLSLAGFLISGFTEAVYNDTEIVMLLFFSLGLAFVPSSQKHLAKNL